MEYEYMANGPDVSNVDIQKRTELSFSFSAVYTKLCGEASLMKGEKSSSSREGATVNNKEVREVPSNRTWLR